MGPRRGCARRLLHPVQPRKKRLIDQKLTSLTLGTPSVGSTSTLVPAKEKWTYRYVSIDQGNATVAGPYTASYDSTYTVVKSTTVTGSSTR